jgi:flagellar hook-length control protein FliK
MLSSIDLQGADIAPFRRESADGGSAPGDTAGGFAALYSSARGSALPGTGNDLPEAETLSATAWPGDETAAAVDGALMSPPLFPPVALETAESAATQPVMPSLPGGGQAGDGQAATAVAQAVKQAQASGDLPLGTAAAAVATVDATTVGAAPRPPEASTPANAMPAAATELRPPQAALASSPLASPVVDKALATRRAGDVSSAVRTALAARGAPDAETLSPNGREQARLPQAELPATIGGKQELLTARAAGARMDNMRAEVPDATLKPLAATPLMETPLAATPPGAAFSLSGTATAPPAPASALPAAINVPVADPGWGEALGERVLWMAGRQMQTAEVRMNPAELGPLTVSVKVDDHTAQISFNAQHPATREAIEQALPRLREMFAAEGLTLTDTSVGEQGLRQDGDGKGAAFVDDPAAADVEDIDGAAPAAPQRVLQGLVDTFA